MAKFPGLKRFARRKYVVRVIVPLHLRPIIGKSELWKTTGTAEVREAKKLYPIIRAQLDAMILDAERKVQPAREVSEADLHQLVRRWFWTWNKTADAAPRPEGSIERDDMLDSLAQDEARAAVTVEEPGLQQLADKFIAEHRIAAEKGSGAWWRIVRLMQAADLELIRRERARMGGAILERATDPFFADVTGSSPAPAPPAPALTFDDLIKRWTAERKPPERTVFEWKRALARLKAHVAHDDPRRVTKSDVIAWKAALLASGKSDKTASNQIAYVRAMYSWAERNELVTSNPLRGVALAKRNGKSGRLPYTDDDAKVILADARKEKGYRRWLPAMLAYTGARIEEVCQALAADIREEDGVWVLDICTGPGKTLKTEGSARLVPLHPALIAEGILEHVKSVKPDGLLFPDVPIDRFGRKSGNVVKWYSRWARDLGIADPRKVAHSWRHRFKDLCRRVGIGKDVHDALSGHASGDVGSRYGLGFTVATLAEAVEKMPVQCPSAAPAAEKKSKARARRRERVLEV